MTIERFARLYKENVNAEQFVLSNIPRSVRRTMALFRTGALTLAIETGRYSRPQVHLNDRLFRRLEAQFDTVFISLSPSVRFNLLISRMHESFCLLKHVMMSLLLNFLTTAIYLMATN
jgi:hypothetical protein